MDEARPNPVIVASAGVAFPPPPACEGARAPVPSPLRQTAEFLVVLLIGILFARTFAAEAYIVPTGSMAPTLLGQHRDYSCPGCGQRFALGTDEDGHSGRPVCPNCGQSQWDGVEAVEGCGDRLLVQKFLFDLRPPRRWETAVFQNPADPSQAYVKRVVALPGESVLIQGGDLFINGKIARKGLAELRAVCVPIFDNHFVPRDAARFPRWISRRGGRGAGASGWRPDGGKFLHEPTAAGGDRIDWLEYRHWQPDRGDFGPVRDFLSYNGVDMPGENRVRDLRIDARLSVGPGLRAVVVRLDSGADRFLITVPVDGLGAVEVRRNGRAVPVGPVGSVALASSPEGLPRFTRLEASVVDHRLIVALDGRPLFNPLDYDDATTGPESHASPLGLGVLGPGRAELAEMRITRDIYYTDALVNAPRRPFGVGRPYQLGADEFFVLGDNSPVSNDSRFWPDSPVVRRELFVGKPFLVHLPSQAVPLQVFGRELYWIPDPWEIRYIR